MALGGHAGAEAPTAQRDAAERRRHPFVGTGGAATLGTGGGAARRRGDTARDGREVERRRGRVEPESEAQRRERRLVAWSAPLRALRVVSPESEDRHVRAARADVGELARRRRIAYGHGASDCGLRSGRDRR
eukprot:1678690-Prymnesium_polylepis.1